MRAKDVYDAVAAVAPIEGVSIANWSDNATWRVDYAPEATAEQQTEAQAVITAINPNAPLPKDVQVERARRLGLGFDYDFGDVRGVHHIGTTEADMVGWRDVIDYANALIDSGDTTTAIAIVTDTGPTSVTAPEWQAIMIQAAVIRQTIWGQSFALQAMSPIPGDYANDSYWT